MATELDFRGVAVGLLVMKRMRDNVASDLRGLRNLTEAFEAGQRSFENMVAEFENLRIPGFPNGIPRKVLEDADSVVEQLTMLNLL